MELTTEKERKRNQKYDRIIMLYNQLKAEQAGYADNRYITAISGQVKMSKGQVRNILLNRGIITTKK